ncbi:MAG: hypothetical protein ACK5XN_22595 [Bacteroidota bacterium]
MEKITRENIERHLLEYQLSMVDKTLMDTIDDDKWWFNITMTQEQHNEFRNYAVKLIRKTFRCNKANGEKTFDWFNGNFGLRIKNK